MPSFLSVQVPVAAAVAFTFGVVTVVAGHRIFMAGRFAGFAPAGVAVVGPDCLFCGHHALPPCM